MPTPHYLLRRVSGAGAFTFGALLFSGWLGPLGTAAAGSDVKRPPPQCAAALQPILMEMAAEVASKFPSTPVRTVVTTASAPRGASIENPEPVACLAELVARALGPNAFATGADTAAPATSKLLRSTPFLEIGLTLKAHTLVATADAHPARGGFWERVKAQRPASGAHAESTRALDLAAEGALRSTLVNRAERVAFPTSDVVAMACGPLGTAGTRIVLSTRSRLITGRLQEGRFVSEAQRTWANLSPIAASPLREPIASVELRASGVLSGSTDRERGVFLSPTLSTRENSKYPVPLAGVGCFVRRGWALGFGGPCLEGDGATTRLDPTLSVDALASTQIVDAEGHAKTFVAFRNTTDSAVTLVDGAGISASAGRAGAALAVADLDQDGVPELLTTEDDLAPEHDALTVWRLERATLSVAARKPIPDGIRALAACPPDSDGRVSVLLATTKDLWVLK